MLFHEYSNAMRRWHWTINLMIETLLLKLRRKLMLAILANVLKRAIHRLDAPITELQGLVVVVSLHDIPIDQLQPAK